jgi:hypothetical protein
MFERRFQTNSKTTKLALLDSLLQETKKPQKCLAAVNLFQANLGHTTAFLQVLQLEQQQVFIWIGESPAS